MFPALGKKLDELSTKLFCQDIAPWKKSIINHLYYTAASTPDGDADLMRAKWISLLNHIMDIHEHTTKLFPQHNPKLYPKCEHGLLEGADRNKAWLDEGVLFATSCHYKSFFFVSNTLQYMHYQIWRKIKAFIVIIYLK